MAKATTTELQKAEPQAVATVEDDVDYSQWAGRGMEGADYDAFAIPFLQVLQKMSPQVDEDSGSHIEGAKPGMIIETVSQKLYDGKVGVLILPCAYRRTFIRWGPRESSGGFKGELTADAVASMRASGAIRELDGRLYAPTEDGSISEKRSDRFVETKNHYCMLYDPDTETIKQVLLSLTSTQIKKSKILMTMMNQMMLTDSKGKRYKPATFQNIVRMTTRTEQNDKGSWHGVAFEIIGEMRNRDILVACNAFCDSVMKGAVTAQYTEEHAAPAPVDDRF